MAEVALLVRESMLILDGGPDAELPPGSGGPVLAGPEAIFVAGRVDADAETAVRLTGAESRPAGLVEAFSGSLQTPDRIVRLVNVRDDVLAEVPVRDRETPLTIYLSDLEEPDEIVVSLLGLDDG